MDGREHALAIFEVVDAHLALVEKNADPVFEKFAADATKRLAVERALQVSIEGLVDVCAIVCASRRLGLPYDEESMIRCVERAGVITEEQARTAVDLKKFRNVLVHQYAKLDPKRVHHHALRAPAAIRGILDAIRPHLGALR